MRILLTNDDGVYAPGLRALRHGAAEARRGHRGRAGRRAERRRPFDHAADAAASSRRCSTSSNQPLGWAVEGRPADCVKLALLELLPEPPDLVVSGLNAGSNAGINVLYSGTVAAAIEGAFFQHTSIAVSLEYTKPKPLDFPRAAELARQVIEQILASSRRRRVAVQRQHPEPGEGPGPRHPRRCRRTSPRTRRRSTAASIRAAGSTSGAARTSAAPSRTPTPT